MNKVTSIIYISTEQNVKFQTFRICTMKALHKIDLIYQHDTALDSSYHVLISRCDNYMLDGIEWIDYPQKDCNIIETR